MTPSADTRKPLGSADDAARNRTLLKTGLVGSVITAVCCFTPLLVVTLGLVGLSAWLSYLDYVLFPALAIFMALTAYAVMRRRRQQSRG